MPSAPDTPCNGCGKLLWSGSTSAPADQRWCLLCRQAGARPKAPRKPSLTVYSHPACDRCRKPFTSARPVAKYCSKLCYTNSRKKRGSRRAKRRRVSKIRHARIVAAGGLTRSAQIRLLQVWKRTRRCAYCEGPCQTIDHVIPLVRGGTNFIGNLLPACRSCNHRKGTRLLSEWRYAVRRAAA